HTRRLEPDEFREHGKRINKLYSAREKQALQKLAEKNNKKKFIKSISRRRILKLQKGLEYAKVPKEFREDAGIQIYYCRTALRVSDREEIRKQIANFVDKKEVGNHLIEFLGVYGIFITPEKKLYDMSNKKEITWQEAGEKITQQFAARLGLAGHLVWKKQKKLFTSKHGSAIWEINVTLAGEVVDLDTVYKPKDTSYANDKSFGEKQQGLDRIFELVSIFRGVAVQAGILRKALNVYIDMVGLQNIRELILKQQIDRLPWIVPDTTSKRGAKLGIMKYNFLDPKV
ncbi:MAG: hypothetical protein Q7K42_00260, partial [Candidatus Diapherotrites archaeon]|nr:hypothetical protein [Candidatus Diapherotrites archaeon]